MGGWQDSVFWGVVSFLVVLVAAALAAGHALLSRREVRSSIGWIGLILLVPLAGAVLYAVFGVNRIRRRAVMIRGGPNARYRVEPSAKEAIERETVFHLEDQPQRRSLAALVGKVVGRRLLAGNHVVPLADGDEAYPAMLEAIDAAERCVTLVTYIFDNDPVGQRFLDSLANAVRRGVEVRVLIDAAGARYSWPRMTKTLQKRGVTVRSYIPLGVGRAQYLNLRNHRKILVADGRVGFTGGMNLRHGHLLSDNPRKPVRDLHFRIEGPVVAHLQEVFAEDWEFASGESLRGDPWFPALDSRGSCLARGIPDGPDEDLDALNWTLKGALTSARESVRIVTPYFLPDPPLTSALNLAALRGIKVDLVLPEHGNLAPVQWAMWGQFWTVMGHGCRIWLTPPPFDHTKVMVVDDEWTLFGSSNWDPRSLRLNFEFNVEVYDRTLARRVGLMVDKRIAVAKRLNPKMLRERSLPVRLRDGAARLLSPYL